MMSRFSFSPLAVALLILGPASATAQSLLCAWTKEADDGKDGRTPSLEWFSGEYILSSVSAIDVNCAGSPDCADLLLGLNGIRIPSQAAYPELGFFEDLFGSKGWHNTLLGNRIYNASTRGALSISWARPRGMIGDRMDGDMLKDVTHIWCVNTDRGNMKLQLSVARDLRWGPAGFLSAIGDIIGISENKEYIGPTPPGRDRDRSWTVPMVLRTTWGFPTAVWQVHPNAITQARQYDQRYRETLKSRYAPNFTTWEFQLHGSIRQMPAQYALCIERKGSQCVKYRLVNTFKYARTLGGEVRMTTYLSHRIGDGDYQPMRYESQFFVLFEGNPIFEEDSLKMEKIADDVEKFCGSRSGCGSIPSISAAGGNPPFGLKMGTDSLAIFQELCQGTGAQFAQSWGISTSSVNCFTEEGNPFVPPSNPTQEELAESVSKPATGIDTAILNRQTITEGRTGIRVMGNDTVRISSQAQFFCLRKAQTDSIDIVNGPREVGQPDPPAVPVDVLYNICAADMNIAPKPGVPTLKLDANRCFVYNGRTYCIR